MRKMSEECIEGGMSTTSKRVKWRLRNFARMFMHENLVRRQMIFFEVTDSRGVTSKWKAQLDFQPLPAKENATDIEPPTNTEPQKYLTLYVSFCSTCPSRSSPLCAKVTPEVEGKQGESIFKGCHTNDCEFTEKNKSVSWVVTALKKNMDISHLLMADGSMVINIDMLIFDNGLDLFSDTFYEGNLAWIRKDEIHRDISSIENDQANSDVTIVSKDGRQFFAYRWILRGASDVFEAMFRVNMKEKNTGVVTLEDLSGNAVKVLLHYVYTGEMSEEWKSPGVVEEVVYAADKFQFQKMKFYLNTRLGKVCTVENAAALLKLANQTRLDFAVSEILKFVHENIRDCETFFSLFNSVHNAATTDASHGLLQNTDGGEYADGNITLQISDTAQTQIQNRLKPEVNSDSNDEGGRAQNNAAVVDSSIASPSPKRKRND